jgi:hypothetical protein
LRFEGRPFFPHGFPAGSVRGRPGGWQDGAAGATFEDIATMDPAFLSAGAALVGSLIGGVSTLTASWLTQRSQLRAQALVHEAVKRETLYAEFISEAARRMTQAWSHHTETPEVIAGLYGQVQRMRLTSSSVVVDRAEQVIRLVVEAYAAPDKSFDELRELIARAEDDVDTPLREFSEACRTELSALRH